MKVLISKYELRTITLAWPEFEACRDFVEVNTVPLSVFNMTATQKKRLKKRTRGGYEAKIEEIKGKFTSLNNRSGNFVERSLSP